MTASGVPSRATTVMRRARRKLAQGFGPRAAAGMRARLKGHRPRRILLFSDGLEYTSEQQFAPLIRHRQAIAARLGLVFSFAGPGPIANVTPDDLAGLQAVGLKLSFKTNASEAEALAARLFGAARAAGVTAIYFDGDDDPCVQWPGVLDAADAYIKKHCFADLGDYARVYVGKTNLTDYAHRTHGISFAENIIPESGPLTPAQADKIVLGWNIAWDDKLLDLARDIDAAALGGVRDIDLLCRASVAQENWIFQMRNAAVTALLALQGRYAVHAPVDRVPQAAYYGEMRRARLTVSPFGYGEICWRDFETILCGSALVKPDMSHLSTWPDLFVPHETYIPVAWDFSDLDRACAPYLDDEARRARLAETARVRLLQTLSRSAILDRLEHVLREAGVPGDR